MASSQSIAKKEEQVKKLADDLKSSKLILLADFRGTTVDDDTKLRKSLREVNGKDTVVKNNIIKRALNVNGVKDLDDVLVGPTTVITTEEDYLSSLKAVYNFSKEHKNYVIKGGMIDGKVMSVDELTTLAKLPSREELLSKLAGSLLQTITKVAIAIDKVRELKETEAPAKEEAKAEEPENKEEVKPEEKKEETKEAKAEENA